MAGVKISDLPLGTPIQRTDIFPVARTGVTLGIRASDILDRITKTETDILAVSGQPINVLDSPTIDLTFRTTTRTLSADLKQNLDLSTRVVRLPCDVETPPGTIVSYLGDTPPCGWLACNGDIIPNTPLGSTNTITAPGLNFSKSGNFSRLFSVIGTRYGTTPGTLPDLRGMFIRGWDQGLGVDAGRAFGSVQQDAFQGHKHDIYDLGHNHSTTTTTNGSHTHNINNQVLEGPEWIGFSRAGSEATDPLPGPDPDPPSGYAIDHATANDRIFRIVSAGNHTHTVTVDSNFTGITIQNPRPDNSSGPGEVPGPGGVPRTSNETRPKNVALLWIVKY